MQGSISKWSKKFNVTSLVAREGAYILRACTHVRAHTSTHTHYTHIMLFLKVPNTTKAAGLTIFRKIKPKPLLVHNNARHRLIREFVASC